MKPMILPLAISVLIASPSIFAGEFIRQQQLPSGLTQDHYVTSGNRSGWSRLPIAEEGSRFTLYAPGTRPDTKLYKIDETTMGTDFPTATMTLSSEDPHFPARTRADKPFTVSLALKGRALDAQKKISVLHSGIAYQSASHAPRAQTQAKNFGWWQLPRNGTHKATFFSRLPSPDPTQSEGRETFTAYTRSKDNSSWTPLKTASIQIWPVAKASIAGITANTTLSDITSTQSVRIHCHDLYPDSITYVQIYHGKEKLGTKGSVMPNTVVRFDTVVPQNQTIPLGEWSDTLLDGKYTLEILTITPFNQRKPERLAHTTFVIDRGMHAPGLVTAQR
jgi:hypothetical protein